MGYGGYQLNLFSKMSQKGFFEKVNRVMELGTQEINCKGYEKIIKNLIPDALKTEVSDQEISKIANRGSARSLYELLGFHYCCVDIEEKYGSICLDLNFDSVPLDHHNLYDLVTNFGTTEHVANQLNAFKVIHDLTKVGGYMWHDVPFTGYVNHGLVNYTTKFFYSLCKSNRYQLCDLHIQPIVAMRKLPEDVVTALNVPDDFAEKFQYRDSGLSVLIQKVQDIPFVPPLDGLPTGMNDLQKSRYWTVTEFDIEKALIESRKKYYY